MITIREIRSHVCVSTERWYSGTCAINGEDHDHQVPAGDDYRNTESC